MKSIADVSDFLKQFGEIFYYVAIGFFTGLFGWVGKIAKKQLEEKKQKNFLKVISQSSIIRDYLVEVRTKYEADRGMLFQIKNGEYYISGESDQKMCLTHLVNAKGVSFLNNVGTTYQNMPVGLLARTLARVISDGYFENKLTLDNIDCYLHSVLFSDGHEGFIMSPAINLKGQVVGMLVLTWNEIPDMWGELDKVEIRKYGHMIGSSLMDNK